MRIAIINCHLNSQSRSFRLSEVLAAHYDAAGVEYDEIHLHEHPVPICDGGPSFSQPSVSELRSRIEACSGIIVLSPVYNYTLSSAVKSLIEHTGQAWQHKIVGFAVTAGGDRSYLAPMSVASQLMLDFRCVVVPKYLYVTGKDFSEDKLSNDEVVKRLKELGDSMVQFASGLSTYITAGGKNN